MVEHRGVVIHIAEGSFEGTISWQKNPASEVSSHFVVASDGRVAQLVDSDITAWTQRAGNGHWISVENEGFTPNPLTPAQVEANAKILGWVHSVYGVPFQIATSPLGLGLGHHSMGTSGLSVPTDTWTGATWGHTDCPGPNIIYQKPTIVALAGGSTLEDDMRIVRDSDNGAVYATTGADWYHIPDPDAYSLALRAWNKTGPDLDAPGVTAMVRALGVEAKSATSAVPVDLDVLANKVVDKLASALLKGLGG